MTYPTWTDVAEAAPAAGYAVVERRRMADAATVRFVLVHSKHRNAICAERADHAMRLIERRLSGGSRRRA